MSVGIVGLGYVGLPLAVSFAEAGEHVIGLEVNARRVAQLRRGDSYIEDVPNEQLQGILSRFEPTTRVAALAKADAIIVCVPTPLTPNREPDLTSLIDSCKAISAVSSASVRTSWSQTRPYSASAAFAQVSVRPATIFGVVRSV